MGQDESFNPRTNRSKVSPDEMANLARQMDSAPEPERVAVDQLGGARVGWFNFSFPFARLQADSSGLSFTALGMRYQFTHENVVALKLYRGWVFQGVAIQHSREATPEILIFWPMGAARTLLAELNAIGWPVVMD